MADGQVLYLQYSTAQAMQINLDSLLRHVSIDSLYEDYP